MDSNATGERGDEGAMVADGDHDGPLRIVKLLKLRNECLQGHLCALGMLFQCLGLAPKAAVCVDEGCHCLFNIALVLGAGGAEGQVSVQSGDHSGGLLISGGTGRELGCHRAGDWLVRDGCVYWWVVGHRCGAGGWSVIGSVLIEEVAKREK